MGQEILANGMPGEKVLVAVAGDLADEIVGVKQGDRPCIKQPAVPVAKIVKYRFDRVEVARSTVVFVLISKKIRHQEDRQTEVLTDRVFQKIANRIGKEMTNLPLEILLNLSSNLIGSMLNWTK